MLKKLRGSLMLLTAAFIWGTAFVAQSKGMDYVAPFTYNAVRTLIGGVVLIPMVFLFGQKSRRKVSENNNKISFIGGIICGLVLFAASSFQQLGISLTSAGKAGFITALYVVIVPVISIIFGQKSNLKMWLCAFTAIIGFYLLCIKEGFRLSKGDLYVLICAVFYSVHIIVIDHFNSKGAEPVKMSCVQFFTAGSIMMICMFIFESPALSAVWAAKYTILYAGVMSCGVAYTLQIIGQKYTESAAAALIMSLESVFAALAGWIILSEHMSMKEFAGCILVFAAVVFSQLDISFKNRIHIKEKGDT
ncbi:DMT family transporter [Ruminococcus flavefaciens]|uniref:DMT family transporter n=1 Tax=Ruminococcus flavefaciens TaxID=1265 RepID=UPI0026EDEA2D|nr:DMT family transporter [Ruminococcus flavefaciens]